MAKPLAKLLSMLTPKRRWAQSPATALVVEPTGEKQFGPCSCCGSESRTVWGFVHRSDVCEAAYFVQWTLGQIPRHGAHFDLVLGRWGDGSNPEDRFIVSLEFRRNDQGPEFMVIDAANRPVSHEDLAGRRLRRNEVIGSPAANQSFEVVDAIWLQDCRIGELTGDA
jgi:hypothetical protein